jgi:hypothetical protein
VAVRCQSPSNLQPTSESGRVSCPTADTVSSVERKSGADDGFRVSGRLVKDNERHQKVEQRRLARMHFLESRSTQATEPTNKPTVSNGKEFSS